MTAETWTAERRMFKAVTEKTSLMAWATDEVGRFFYLSPEWFRFTGHPVDESSHIEWTDVVRTDERKEVANAFALANRRRQAFGMPYWLRRADGGYARIWDVGLPKFDEHGRFHGFFGTICPLDQFEPIARHETPNLSPREREVLRLVSEGNTTATIAAMLGLADRTVDTHVNNAVAKLGAFNRVHAVATAMKRNEL